MGDSARMKRGCAHNAAGDWPSRKDCPRCSLGWAHTTHWVRRKSAGRHQPRQRPPGQRQPPSGRRPRRTLRGKVPFGIGGPAPTSSPAAEALQSRSRLPHPTARRLRVFDRDHRRGRVPARHRHGGSPPAVARRSTPLSPSARCGRYTVRAPAATRAPTDAACATTTTNTTRIGWQLWTVAARTDTSKGGRGGQGEGQGGGSKCSTKTHETTAELAGQSYALRRNTVHRGRTRGGHSARPQRRGSPLATALPNTPPRSPRNEQRVWERGSTRLTPQWMQANRGDASSCLSLHVTVPHTHRSAPHTGAYTPAQRGWRGESPGNLGGLTRRPTHPLPTRTQLTRRHHPLLATTRGSRTRW